MSVKYAFIRSEEGNYPMVRMCIWAGVSKSGYYQWRDRPSCAQARRRAELTAIVGYHFEDSDGTYGYRRIAVAMNRAGQHVDEGTVAAIMGEQALVACQVPSKGPITTTRADDTDGLPDLLERDLAATEPGVKLVGDITYIGTWAGWVYLAVVLDCFSKKAVGWAMAEHMRTELVTEALAMAARNGHVHHGRTVFGSGRGSQYMSTEFKDFCGLRGIARSVGRTGVCWDNVWAESWNGTLKVEPSQLRWCTRHARKRSKMSPGGSSCATIRNDSTRRWGTARRTRSTRNGEPHKTQPKDDCAPVRKNPSTSGGRAAGQGGPVGWREGTAGGDGGTGHHQPRRGQERQHGPK